MATAVHRSHRPHLSLGVLSAIVALVLAALSFYLVLVAIPDAFTVTWSCFGPGGSERTAGDTYVSGFVVLGALGWLAALGGTAIANATGSTKLAFAIPVAWFTVLTGLAIVTAWEIGPLPC
jgi:hypothetical protein